MPGSPQQVPGVPPLQRSSRAAVSVGGHKIRVATTDVHGSPLELVFRPYQALRVTTVDCVRGQSLGAPLDLFTYRRESAWLDELKATLAKVDTTATFMEKALHFVLGPGDDVIEVAAWQVEIVRDSETVGTFPEGVEPSPF